MKIGSDYSVHKITSLPRNNNLSNTDIPVSSTVHKSAANTNGVYNIAFHGLFSASLNEKIEAGFQKADEQNVFLFTDDVKTARNVLYAKMMSNILNFDFVINNFYILEDKTHEGVSFIVYKDKKGNYKLSSLGNEPVSNDTTYAADKKSKDTFAHKTGESITVKPNDKLTFGLHINDPFSLKFVIPSSDKKSIIDKYFQKVSAFDDEDKIKRLNLSTIQSLSNNSNSEKIKYAYNKTFDDIGGYENLKDELWENIICPLLYPTEFENVRLNRGVILYGPPRCGKTMFAMSIANMANVYYKKVNARDLITKEVGQSEQNLKNVFEEVIAHQPSILVFDEIDCISAKRKGTSMSTYEDTFVSQFLAYMSELEKSGANVFVIGTTNRKDLIDNAMLQSGRFGLHMEVPLPDKDALGKIYDIYIKDVNIADDADKTALVDKMSEMEFSGSDVAEMISLGMKNALKRNDIFKKMRERTYVAGEVAQTKVTQADLIYALDRIAAQKID